MASTHKRPATRQRRGSSMAAAFLLGLPLAVGVLAACPHLPEGSLLQRYTSHPIEKAEIVLFCCALAALFSKVLGHLRERLAFRRPLLPPFQGEPVPAADAAALLARVRGMPRWLLRSRLGQRVVAVLDFVVQRQSASGLDDHLRALADEDALSLDTSYSLNRFISWAIPILGFLGTVLGITGAISGVTPEVLEQSLGTVTDGLALAFDTTAVALCLTMVAMFCSFLVERLEQGLLEDVDAHVECELAHRFLRLAPDTEPVRLLVEENGQAILRTVNELVLRQAEIWAHSLAEMEQRRAVLLEEQQQRLTTALEAALRAGLEAQADRAAQLERETVQQATLLYEQLHRMSTSLQAQVELLHQLQEDEHRLTRLQSVLAQNLEALAGAGAFEQAVHSLTASIHLLTAARPALGLARSEGKAA